MYDYYDVPTHGALKTMLLSIFYAALTIACSFGVVSIVTLFEPFVPIESFYAYALFPLFYIPSRMGKYTPTPDSQDPESFSDMFLNVQYYKEREYNIDKGSLMFIITIIHAGVLFFMYRDGSIILLILGIVCIIAALYLMILMKSGEEFLQFHFDNDYDLEAPTGNIVMRLIISFSRRIRATIASDDFHGFIPVSLGNILVIISSIILWLILLIMGSPTGDAVLIIRFMVLTLVMSSILILQAIMIYTSLELSLRGLSKALWYVIVGLLMVALEFIVFVNDIELVLAFSLSYLVMLSIWLSLPILIPILVIAFIIVAIIAAIGAAIGYWSAKDDSKENDRKAQAVLYGAIGIGLSGGFFFEGGITLAYYLYGIVNMIYLIFPLGMRNFLIDPIYTDLPSIDLVGLSLFLLVIATLFTGYIESEAMANPLLFIQNSAGYIRYKLGNYDLGDLIGTRNSITTFNVLLRTIWAILSFTTLSIAIYPFALYFSFLKDVGDNIIIQGIAKILGFLLLVLAIIDVFNRFEIISKYSSKVLDFDYRHDRMRKRFFGTVAHIYLGTSVIFIFGYLTFLSFDPMAQYFVGLIMFQNLGYFIGVAIRYIRVRQQY